MTLFLECKPDEVLAVTLGVSRKSITHNHGKGRVSRSLQKNSGVVGLVDEDPGSAEPAAMKQFSEVSINHDVRLKINKSRKNRLIVLCPRLEPWLIKSAKAAGVKMDEFGLSENVQVLDSMINHRLQNVERLLAALLSAPSPRLLYLKSLLNES